MKIAAFSKSGSCGVMGGDIQEVVEMLIEQDADLTEYTYYYVDETNPQKLALTHDI